MRMFLTIMMVILNIFLLAQLGFGQELPDSETAWIKARANEIQAKKAREESEKALEKTLKPAERQALKELKERRKEAEELIKRTEEARASVGLTGCRTQEEANLVVIHYAVGTTRGLRPSGGQSVLQLVVTNRSSSTASIRAAGLGISEPLVENLCSGGSLTLTLATSYLSADYTSIELTALTQSLGSGTGVQTRSVSLHRPRDYNDRRVDGETWELR